MKMISLNGSWQGKYIDENGTKKFVFEGNVSGCVHTDLSRKYIPDDILQKQC